MIPVIFPTSALAKVDSLWKILSLGFVRISINDTSYDHGGWSPGASKYLFDKCQ